MSYDEVIKAISSGFAQFTWLDVLDIIIICVLLYKLIIWTKETRAYEVLKGLGLLFLCSVASQLLQLNTLSWLLDAFLKSGTIIVVLVVLFGVVMRTLSTGIRSEDRLGSFICTGIAGAILAQILINVGMNLRVLPVIGITLPFYSAGGTSVLMMYICVGLILSVYMHNKKTLFGNE